MANPILDWAGIETNPVPFQTPVTTDGCHEIPKSNFQQYQEMAGNLTEKEQK